MSSIPVDTSGAAQPAAPSLANRARRGARIRVRVGQGVLVALFALAGVISLSTLFAEDPFPPAATVLIASFGALSAVLGITAVIGGIGSRVVRVGLWALPLFFVWHVAALGTWVPDAVFAVVAAVGVVLVSGVPGSRGPRATRS